MLFTLFTTMSSGIENELTNLSKSPKAREKLRNKFVECKQLTVAAPPDSECVRSPH